ncbi:FT-interacting protein 1-like [Iris pallida]|uniref:FT-interacting protein 1-like n=1 Tax=Iris pallida TaxID=29817 RepID=A0AAX6E483_IRIPA|nr:FT-interacting protein 1-like [Iris pallida]KAJ6819183.1 FT-interacting protein 1-like [Iris pallida]
MLLKLQLLHERALHRGQLKVAQQLSYKFGVLASPVIGVDMEIKTEASLSRLRCSFPNGHPLIPCRLGSPR